MVESTILANQDDVVKYLEGIGAKEAKLSADLTITYVGLKGERKITVPAGAKVRNFVYRHDGPLKIPQHGGDLCVFEYVEDKSDVYITVRCGQRVTKSHRAPAKQVPSTHLPQFRF